MTKLIFLNQNVVELLMIDLEVLDTLQLIELSLPEQLLQTEALFASENVGLEYHPSVHFFWVINYFLDVEDEGAHSLLAE